MLNPFRQRFNRHVKKAGVITKKAPTPGYAGPGKINTASLTWVYVHKWATEELDIARLKNDELKRDALQTQAIRGRIELLKEILALPELETRLREMGIASERPQRPV